MIAWILRKINAHDSRIQSTEDDIVDLKALDLSTKLATQQEKVFNLERFQEKIDGKLDWVIKQQSEILEKLGNKMDKQ